jgi:T5SS/PEP-CTERM-associated repeat protein
MVSDGASVTYTNQMAIGADLGSSGMVTVTGKGSSLEGDRITIGVGGSGVMVVSDGASLTSSDAYLGDSDHSGATVTITGEGSSWSNSGNLHVGYYGHAGLTISTGAVVSNSIGYIGYDPYDNGNVLVTGTGSRWTNSSALYIGIDETDYLPTPGVLTISDGAQVTVRSSTVLASAGKINLALSNGNQSLLIIGDNTHTNSGLNNGGTVNFFAVGSMDAGTYTPISIGSAASYVGSGVYRGFGGSWSSSSGEFMVNGLTAVGFGAYSQSLAGMRLSYADGRFISAFSDGSTGTDFAVEVIAETGLDEAIVAYTITSATVSIEDVLLCFDVEDYIGADGYLLMYRASAADEWVEYDYTVVSSFYTEQDGYLSLVASVDADTGIGGYGDYALIAVPEPEQFAAILGLLVLLAACRRRMREKC